MIYEYFQISATEGQILEFEDLLHVQLQGDNLPKFITDWDATLLGLRKPQDEETLESLFRKQLLKSKQLEQLMTLYWSNIQQKVYGKSYERLYSMVKTHIQDRRRARNRDNAEQMPKGRAAFEGVGPRVALLDSQRAAHTP